MFPFDMNASEDCTIIRTLSIINKYTPQTFATMVYIHINPMFQSLIVLFYKIKYIFLN